MSKIKILILISGLILSLAVFIGFYRMFFTSADFEVEKRSNIRKVKTYKSGQIILIRSLNVSGESMSFFVDFDDKKIFLPSYETSFISVGSLGFFRRDHIFGIPLTSSAKVGEQNIKWLNDKLVFTYGENKEYEFVLNFK